MYTPCLCINILLLCFLELQLNKRIKQCKNSKYVIWGGPVTSFTNLTHNEEKRN
ncbi:hypothetical protein BAE44_0022421 [Dichanthelium oligosanthes]|uniref:Uncharacterized protein n=1 Tax=Dichanthelium oligosanthes TaxID=888268 RepID=A0A1E5UUK4_9POAL|nr:hypothetical protein BAE44_0022421 [Dichanthelium oligosanthes]